MRKFIIRTPKDFSVFLNNLNKQAISIDTETTSLKYMELEMEQFSMCDGRIACVVDLINNENKEEILKQLQTFINETKIIAMHNAVYDYKVLHKHGIIIPEEVELFCTMVGDHLIEENRRSHSLKYLAENILNYSVVEFGKASNEGRQSKKFLSYAINDAIWTYELMVWQRDLLKQQGLVDLFRTIEMPFQRVIADMEINGMLVDVDLVRRTRANIQEALSSITVKLCNKAGIEYEVKVDDTSIPSIQVESSINFSSSKQVADLLFNKLGLPVIEYTPGGAPSVGKFTIEKLKDQSEVVQLLHVYKKLNKLLTSYFNENAQILSNIDSDNRVRPSFRDTGTVTGRLSCSNPNLQQLPKKDKETNIDTRLCFVAPAGKKLIACDYSGQELRVLTQQTQEPALIDTFKKGKDMHLSTANDFFELGIAEEDLYENSERIEELKDKFKAERNKAKIINFGMAYGKGAYGFSLDFGIDEEEAQEILDKYFAALPKVKETIEETHDRVREEGYVTSMSGRRRRFKPNSEGYYPGSAYRQSFNFLIQGYSADMIRMAMNSVRQLSMKNPQWELKAIATVHDEAVYEVKEQYAQEAAKEIKKAFESVVKFVVPLVADVSIGNNYSEAK